MKQEKFFEYFNKVLSLLIDNKLREDIDDTLLEKLLKIFEDGSAIESFINDLINNTQILTLFNKTVTDLLDESKNLSSTIKAFSLRLFGIVLQNQNVFIELRNSEATAALSDLSRSKSFLKYSPSIQDALLATLMSLATHIEGALWLIEHKFISYTFSSFSSSSYYVKKTGIKFFTSILQLWSSLEFNKVLQDSQRSFFEEKSQIILSNLIMHIQKSEDTCTENFSNCCILTLKQLFESTANIPDIHLALLEEIVTYFKIIDGNSKINPALIELLLSVYYKYPSDTSYIKEVMVCLLRQKKFLDAIHLTSSFLSSFKQCHPVRIENLFLFLIPLRIIVGCEGPDFCDMFHVPLESAHASLYCDMESKSIALPVLVASISALSKLTAFMRSDCVELVIITIADILQEKKWSEKFYDICCMCLNDRRLCLAILELISSLLSNKMHQEDYRNGMSLLFKSLVHFLKTLSTDCNILSEALRLLKSCIVLNADQEIILSEEEMDELVSLLCRKLFDNKESVVDSALHLIGEVMNGKGQDEWKKTVMKYSLLQLVWDIAIEGNHDGVIKASALNVLAHSCMQEFYFTEIKSQKDISKADMMNILCNCVFDNDFFIQREALVCASKWMQTYYSCLPESCKDNLFLIFSSAVRSLDLDLKLSALTQWQIYVENETFFPSLLQCNIESCISLYCSSGYGASLLYTLEDYDEAVKYKAATMMFELKEKLIGKGVTKDSLVLDTSDSKNKSEQNIPDYLSALSVSREQRNESLNSVMELSTAEQILNLCKVRDSPLNYNRNFTVPEIDIESFSCSVSSFWNSLWSGQIDGILVAEEVSTCIFSDYSLSLLDDIILAEKTEIYDEVNDTPDCY